MAQDINLNNSMKRKLKKQSAAAAICIILERKKSRNMCQNAFFPCLQNVLIYKRTEYGGDQSKRRYNSQRKNSLLFLKFCKKNQIC